MAATRARYEDSSFWLMFLAGVSAVVIVIAVAIGAAKLLSPAGVALQPAVSDPVFPRPEATARRLLPGLRNDHPPQVKRARSIGASGAYSVISATHTSYASAKRHAEKLQARFSGCECAVYPDAGADTRHFFVLAGTGLSRSAAGALRDAAVASGLPGDTYVSRLKLP